MVRSEKIETFLEAVLKIFVASNADAETLKFAEKIFKTAKRIPGKPATPTPTNLPACNYLNDALEHAKSVDGPVSTLATAINDLLPYLRWVLRPNGENDDDLFKKKHANAVVIGDGGIETHDSIRIGMSLLAPQTRYPDHHHPPEEIYAVLSQGEWKQGTTDNFFTPGVGGIVHNIPNIVHGMRSKETPLLAVWSLWTGDNS